MNPKLTLPEELEKHREVLENTERDVIVATLLEETPVITDSKLGGTPYYPEGMVYPLDKKGEPMLLLAQINFSDLPDNDKFPKQGLLQFFLPKSDELFGWDEGNGDDDIKILFHENVISELNQTPLVEWKENYEDEDGYFPVAKSSKFQFSKTTEFINSQVDYYYSDLIQIDLSECGIKEIDSQDSHYQTKLLGYPGFCQQDPRQPTDDRDILLFQLSTETDNVYIADAGIMNFFISPSDLKKLDFSNVLYNWDCY